MHQHINGEQIPCEVTLIRVSRHGEDQLLSFVRDLHEFNERKRAEIAEESNMAKSRFLARMSHEIRTPITAVLGISEIQLQNPSLPPDIEESFAKIYDSSNMLLGIINDILDLSKIEADKMSMVYDEYETASLINDVMQPYIVYIGDKDIAFNVHVNEWMPRLLVGDSLRIKQIMHNILSNAFKYTESGAVNLSIKCQSSETDESRVNLVISVRDTGLGMTEEQLNMLFKAEYVRFHEKGAFVTGTGLGMTIVHRLAQMMNAKIDMESEVGKGTKVIVCIPQEVAGAETIRKRNSQQFASL
jgi:signal transduction histidine kinase